MHYIWNHLTFFKLNEIVLFKQPRDNDLITNFVYKSFETPKDQTTTPTNFIVQKTSILDHIGDNLTTKASSGDYNHLINRNALIRQLSIKLLNPRQQALLLIGVPGVGKTTLLQLFAQQLVLGQVPPLLANKTIYHITYKKFSNYLNTHPQIETYLKHLLYICHSDSNIILVIDNLQDFFPLNENTGYLYSPTSVTQGPRSEANFRQEFLQLLKTLLTFKSVSLICLTTIINYKEYFEKKFPLLPFFKESIIQILPPSELTTFKILLTQKGYFEKLYHLKMSADALRMIITSAKQMKREIVLPLSAFQICEDLCSNLLYYTNSHRTKKGPNALTYSIVTDYEVNLYLKMKTGLATEDLKATFTFDIEKLTQLEHILHSRIIGQDTAVQAITKAIQRAQLGIRDLKKPIASFLFCGPTGVGKTEIAKVVTITLFGSLKHLIRFDMSEFMEKHAVSRLIGTPPGYVGYEAGGELTNALLKSNYAVVLFDEVEKAHADIFTLFLQLLDEGYLNDTKKNKVDFTKTIIILTSNLGAEAIQQVFGQSENSQISLPEDGISKHKKSYFYKSFFNKILTIINTETFEINATSSSTIPLMKVFPIKTRKVDSVEVKQVTELVMTSVKAFFKPELINRIDKIIVFKPLLKTELFKICHLLLDDLMQRFKQKNLRLEIHTDVKIKLTQLSYNPSMGARPLKRTITTEIEDLLVDYLLQQKEGQGHRAVSLVVKLDTDLNIKIYPKY